ncbi:MAG: steroid delta-isomerase [Bacteroidetes bacterium]|nr:MAG: steroid delta-isomerase [Bacteroidota bacterium]
MRYTFICSVFLFLFSSVNLFGQSDSLGIISPEALVQQQLDGYNARDIDAFMAPYSEEIELYDFPNTLNLKGKEKMKTGYQDFFKKVPELHCELVNRIVMGNTVIDQEKVTGFPDGFVLEAIAIYKIRDGKIASVHFIRKN